MTNRFVQTQSIVSPTGVNTTSLFVGVLETPCLCNYKTGIRVEVTSIYTLPYLSPETVGLVSR